MDFFARFTFGYCRQDSSSISMRAKKILLESYSKPAIQPHNGFRSSSSIANFRSSLSSLMAWRRCSFASSMRPVTLA